VQREIDKPAAGRPAGGGLDERPAGTASRRERGHGKLTDVAVKLASEVSLGPHADHTDNRVLVDGHEDGALPRRGRVQRTREPAVPGHGRLRLVPPGGDPFGEPRG
jgi:hypothetical protein